MKRPFYSLIPPTITFFLDMADYAARGGNGIPGDPHNPYKPWLDSNAFTFGATQWWEPTQVPQDRTYQIIHRDSNDNPVLIPMDSLQARSTYSFTVLSTYQEFSFLFPDGIPSIIPHDVRAHLAQLNMHGAQPLYLNFPIFLQPSQMLVPDTSMPGGIAVWDYQDFIRAHRAPIATPKITVSRIQQILNSPMPPEQQLAAIRLLLQK